MLAGEGWHPGVIGIVASRIAERHGRPVRGDRARRRRGHRQRPVDPGLRPARRARRRRRAPAPPRRPPRRGRAARSAPRRRRCVPRRVRRARRGACSDARGLRARPSASTRSSRATSWAPTLAEELERLAPFGQANPDVVAARPRRPADRRAADGGGQAHPLHRRGRRRAGPRRRLRHVPRLPDGAEDGLLDATFGLELNEWNGTVEPRLVLRNARAVRARPDPRWPASRRTPVAAALAEAAADPRPGSVESRCGARRPRRCLDARRDQGPPGRRYRRHARRPRRHRRAGAGASAPTRGRGAAAWRAGSAASRSLSYAALARDPGLAAGYAHLVALDPPAEPAHEALLHGGRPRPNDPSGLGRTLS